MKLFCLFCLCNVFLLWLNAHTRRAYVQGQTCTDVHGGKGRRVPSRKRERAVQSRTDMHVRARRCTEVYRVSSRRPADCVLQWLWPAGWTSHGVYACDTGQEGVQRNYKQWRGIWVTFQCNTFKLYVPHVQAKKATIKVEILDESDVTHLRGTVIGPPDTPFEGELVQCVCVCVWFSEPGIYTMF